MSEATKSGAEAKAAEPLAAQAAADQASEEHAADTEAQAAEAQPVEAQAALLAELESVQALAREREVQYVRLRADFDNFRRRKEQEAAELKQRAAEGVFADLLPVADNLERAIAASVQAADDDGRDGLRKGVEMVLGQLRDVLARHGVAAMEVVGLPFDPNLHEAVMEVEVEAERAGAVVEEIQRGYTLAGRVLRPALVKVGRS